MKSLQILGLLAGAALVWLFASVLLERVGLDVLDPLVPIGAVFGFLHRADRWLQRDS